jgi:plastocyanin
LTPALLEEGMDRKLVTAGFVVVAAAASWAGATKSQADGAQPSGVVTGTVSIQKDGSPKANRSNVVVSLEGVPRAIQPQTKIIHQRDLTFLPGLMVVVKGSTVEFPNDDKVFHNVFSVSRGGKFDLGLYKSGTSKSVTFKEAGVIDVYCNIHPQMAAKIKVVDTTFYAVTGADGTFKIKNVPPGTYPIVAWQAYGSEYRGEVKVAPGGATDVQVSLVEADAPQRHLRKDGTPYGRYK